VSRGELFNARRSQMRRSPGTWAISTSGGVVSNQNHTTGLAEWFVVGAGQSLTVTALALYTSNAPMTNCNAVVVIWETTSGNPVAGATATFSTGGTYPLVAGTYRSITLGSPVVLGPGSYAIGAYSNVSNYNVQAGGNVFTLSTFGGKVTWGSGRFTGTPGALPSGAVGTAPQYALATFLGF
jgi:hypothetical protein